MPDIKDIALSDLDFSNRAFVFRHTSEVDELANSIQYEGMIHPPVLMAKASGKHVIVAGYLRLLAAKKLNTEKVRALVYSEKELEREEFLKIAIAENTKRQNLRPVEIAEALRRIQEELDLTNEELAAEFGETFGIGKTAEQVERYLKLNRFDTETKDFLAQNPAKDMDFELLKVEDDADRKELVNLVREHKDIRKSQLGQIINHARVIEEKAGKGGMKGVFAQGAIREILDNSELSGSKKINTFLAALEKEADPQRIAKQEAFDKLATKLDLAFEEKNHELVRKVSVRKAEFGKHEIRVTLIIESTEDLIEMMKTLYDVRKTVIEPMIRL